MLGKMGFNERWKGWMSCCLRIASASVLVNGSPIDEFLLERGLRHGDPLSSFLFLIVAEALNNMIK